MSNEKTAEADFIKATKEWYRFVSEDYHKDLDCHWYVGYEQKYSYGDKPEVHYWYVRHRGYILDDEEVTGHTKAAVLKLAAKLIRDLISESKSP